MSLSQIVHAWYEHLHDILRQQGGLEADLMAHVPGIAAILSQRATMPELDQGTWDPYLMDSLREAGFDQEQTGRLIAILKAEAVPGVQ
jgi:hypothetical protein